MDLFQYIEFLATIIITLFILSVIFLDYKWFKRLQKEGIGVVYRNPKDKQEVNQLDLAYCVREHYPIKMIAGYASPKICNKNFFKAVKEVSALYKNSNNDFAVEIICGPIILINNKRKNYVLEAARNGWLKLYRSNIYQEQHFRIGLRENLPSCYVEQPHGFFTDRRELETTIYINNWVETNYYFKKFRKIRRSKDVELVNSDNLKDIYNQFILLTKENFLSKYKILRKKGKDIHKMTYEELKKELKV